jgi:putative transport protein
MEASLRAPGTAPLPGSAEEFLGAQSAVAIRTYALHKSNAIGRRLAELRQAYPLLSIERILRSGQLIEARDDVILREGDTVALHGTVDRLLGVAPRLGPEVDAPALRETGPQTADVIVQSGEVAGQRLIDLARDIGHGLYLNAIFRAGDQIPKGADVVVQKGDLLRVTGSPWRIDRFGKRAGRILRPSLSTDIVTLALGLTAGALIGLITIPIGSIRLTLGSAVGLLLVGIALSTVRTRHPAFGGPFPEPARQLLEDLGLNVFVAVLGINSGIGVIRALSTGALTPIILGTLIIGFLPAIVAWIVGRRVMRLYDALLLGAVAGARCNSAGLRAAQEASHSAVPAISYPATFAITNLVFTAMSYVMAILG